MLPLSPPAPSGAHDGPWLRRFQRGDAEVLAAPYHEHFDTVARAVGGVLTGADREGVIHEVSLNVVNAVLLTAYTQGRVAAGWEQARSSDHDASPRPRLRLLR